MIGVTIKTLLEANSALMLLVPTGRIFPCFANEKVPMPIIVYTIDSISPRYTKGISVAQAWVEDECDFSVHSVCNDYMTLQNIAKQVRIALEWQCDSSCHPIRVTGQSERFSVEDMVFVNVLEFKTDIIII